MENLNVKLHVFVDASTKVFAATVYARILNRLQVDGFNESIVNATAENHDQGQVTAVTLITAKARVMPMKTESVSRLELAACVIGTRLGLTVANAMDRFNKLSLLD